MSWYHLDKPLKQPSPSVLRLPPLPEWEAGLTRRMQARDMLLRMSIPERSVIEQNTDDCEALFRQKAHRACEKDKQKKPQQNSHQICVAKVSWIFTSKTTRKLLQLGIRTWNFLTVAGLSMICTLFPHKCDCCNRLEQSIHLPFAMQLTKLHCAKGTMLDAWQSRCSRNLQTIVL